MVRLDDNLLKISRRYLFSIIEEKKDRLREKYSDEEFVDLGVGDISLPLAPSIVEGLINGAKEMGRSVIGYGPYEGYPFLREAIAASEYSNVGISSEEIFVSEGINTDLCALQELFTKQARVGITDPTYPVYNDLNLMAGRETIIRIPLIEEYGYMPQLPKEHLDLIYLTSPCNPTGVAMTRNVLSRWVNWAREHESLIFFDAAYAAFIRSNDVPKTIYEIEGAKEVAIECRSFSKSAGFTGVRLGYCVVPRELNVKSGSGQIFSAQSFWRQRQSIKTNGISYPIQKAGLAALSPQGKKECREQIDEYLRGAKKIRHVLEEMGYSCVGGIDSPYIWWKIPGGDSWKWFDYLLQECLVLSIPGAGFGGAGEGYVRLSGFVTEAKAEKAVRHLSKLGAVSET